MVIRCHAMRILLMSLPALFAINAWAQPTLPEISAIYHNGTMVLSWDCQYDNVKSIKVLRSDNRTRDFYTIGFVTNLQMGKQVYVNYHPLDGVNCYQVEVSFLKEKDLSSNV